ncbi:MAG: DJ-1 family glyoxalase III [Bacteroidales bacterium]|nr:DJ-1 family glyoxalase III [Bacteroidales bacterium]
MNHAYIFLADGFEEIEALATLDILRRAGIYARTVSISDSFHVTGAHDVQVIADYTYEIFCAEEEELDSSDVLVFPGGMPGSSNLAADEELIDLMKGHFADGGLLAGICAAPGLVLSQNDGKLLKGRKFTCYDGCEAPMLEKGAKYEAVPAVKDGNLITGRGPAFTIDFALEIVKAVRGEEIAEKVKKGLLL